MLPTVNAPATSSAMAIFEILENNFVCIETSSGQRQPNGHLPDAASRRFVQSRSSPELLKIKMVTCRGQRGIISFTLVLRCFPNIPEQ
jgi:hypothetical protein